MVLSQANAVLILLPAELFSRDLLVTILTNIMKRGSEKYHIAIKAGVGASYEYIEDFKKSYQEMCIRDRKRPMVFPRRCLV